MNCQALEQSYSFAAAHNHDDRTTRYYVRDRKTLVALELDAVG